MQQIILDNCNQVNEQQTLLFVVLKASFVVLKYVFVVSNAITCMATANILDQMQLISNCSICFVLFNNVIGKIFMSN